MEGQPQPPLRDPRLPSGRPDLRLRYNAVGDQIMRTTATCILIVLVAGLGAAALGWTEIAAMATVTTGSDGGPAIVFTIQLEYDRRPSSADVSFGWTIYDLDKGQELEEYSFYRSTTLTGGALRLSFASARVPVVPGTRYRGRVVVDDAANDLQYRRDIDYTAPVVLPVGLVLSGTNDTEEIPLGDVPDEEIEEMATAYDLLQASFSHDAEGVTLEAFFAEVAIDSASYPAAVYVVPVQGDESPFGTQNSPVTFRITPSLYAYPVPDPSAASALLEQLSAYDRTFVGLVFSSEDPQAGLFDAVSVFVGETAWRVLEAAKAEETRRLATD